MPHISIPKPAILALFLLVLGALLWRSLSRAPVQTSGEHAVPVGKSSEKDDDPTSTDITARQSLAKGRGSLMRPEAPKGGKTWHPYISRSEPYPLNKIEIEDALVQLRAGKKPSIRIKLFEHGYKTLLLANDEKIDANVRGFSISGSFDGHPGSVGVISRIGDSYAGVALVPNIGYFRIKTVQVSGNPSVVIEEITRTGGCGCNPLNAALGGGVFQTIIPSGLNIDNSQAVAETPDLVYIGVSFGYTLQAAAAADAKLTIENPSGTASSADLSGIEACTTAALAYANQVHRQSGSVARFYAASFSLLPSPEIFNESLLLSAATHSASGSVTRLHTPTVDRTFCMSALRVALANGAREPCSAVSGCRSGCMRNCVE